MEQDDFLASDTAILWPRMLKIITRVLEVSCLAVMVTWIFLSLGGLRVSPLPNGIGGNDTSQLFNWHPLLITLAFPVFMAEAVLSYKSPLFSISPRSQKKALHFGLQSSAAVLTLLAAVAAFQSHNLKQPEPIPNLYSTHSYLGMMVLVLFSMQYVVGFLAYVFPKWSLKHRKAVGPLHVFFGKSIFVLGMTTMAVGIQEKTTFVQTSQKPSLFAAVMKLPATLNLLLALTTMAVLYHHAAPAAIDETPQGDSLEVSYQQHTENQPLQNPIDTHRTC